VQPQSPIFRQVALERLSSPERLDLLLRVTQPRSWIALATICAIVVIAAGWSIFGRVPTAITGRGLMIDEEGVLRINSPVAGEVTEMRIRAGQVVREGDVVATIRTPTEGSRTVAATIGGEVIAQLVWRGDFIREGTIMFLVDPATGSADATLYVPFAVGKRAQPGMPVQIAPTTARREEYGVMSGEVVRVADFPATAQEITALVDDADLAKQYLSQGSVVQVRVHLSRDPATPSGFVWSSGEGPPYKITNGTPVVGTIVIDEQRPISLLFPAAR
jgi:multidrug resistance efflux pump